MTGYQSPNYETADSTINLDPAVSFTGTIARFGYSCGSFKNQVVVDTWTSLFLTFPPQYYLKIKVQASTEDTYDFLTISDQLFATPTTTTGTVHETDFRTTFFDAGFLNVSIQSDSSVAYNGFIIDYELFPIPSCALCANTVAACLSGARYCCYDLSGTPASPCILTDEDIVFQQQDYCTAAGRTMRGKAQLAIRYIDSTSSPPQLEKDIPTFIGSYFNASVKFQGLADTSNGSIVVFDATSLYGLEAAALPVEGQYRNYGVRINGSIPILDTDFADSAGYLRLVLEESSSGLAMEHVYRFRVIVKSAVKDRVREPYDIYLCSFSLDRS